jgi:electron transfer flavoprotein alpha subunit
LLIAIALGEQLSPMTAELAGEAVRLSADVGGPVTALLAGKSIQGLPASLGGLGVDKVLVADSQSPTPPSPEWLLSAAAQAARESNPTVILLTHGGGGRDLGPSLAYRLETGIVTDATALRVEDGQLVITKPVFGGSAIAEFSVTSTPSVVTLRPRAFEAREAPTPKDAQVEAISPSDTSDAIEVLEEIREQSTTGPRLKDAKVIISGGRGLGGPENWHYIDELAQVLGAAVGATRAVTDAGWVPPSFQVGLTGATVAPDLYITIGISGAVQHIAGISGARNVVAINRDGDANIFKYARFGVVGDWKQIVPAFTERLKELRG